MPTTIPDGGLIPREPIGSKREDLLLDVSESLQSLPYDFLGRGALFARRKYLIYFLLERVHNEFVNRGVAARIGTLLYSFQQFALQLHLVRAEHVDVNLNSCLVKVSLGSGRLKDGLTNHTFSLGDS